MRQLKIKQPPIDNNRAQEIENYLSAIGNTAVMPREKEMAALIRGVKAGDIAATEKFTCAYRNIAISIARQECHKTELPFKVLVDISIAEYVAGIRRSKENTVKILAHATWWIKQSMLEYIAETT